MAEWFKIPDHLIFAFCIGTVIIMAEFVVILILINKIKKQEELQMSGKKTYGKGKIGKRVARLEDFWSPFVIYVLATSIICLFTVSLVKEKHVTLDDINNWVSIILGLISLVVGITSLWLGYYNVEQASQTQETVQKKVEELQWKKRGWKVDADGEWVYLDKNGDMIRNEWKLSGENQYYLGEKGYIEKNKIIFGDNEGELYYVDERGCKVKNVFKTVQGKKMYFDESGKAVMNGMKEIDGVKYMFKDGYVIDSDGEAK